MHFIWIRRLNPQLPDCFAENVTLRKPNIEPASQPEYQRVFIRGPANQSENDTSLDWMGGRSALNDLAVDENTLGAAIARYSEKYDVEIVPYDGEIKDMLLVEEEKYFLYTDAPSHSVPYLVDIHIEKLSGEEVCPKQNLLFPVEYGDIIHIHSTLIC